MQSTNLVDVSLRLRTGHPPGDVVPSIRPREIAFKSKLPDESSGSMSQQSKVGVARSSINGIFVLKNEQVFAGNSAMLSHTRRPGSGSVEVPDA